MKYEQAVLSKKGKSAPAKNPQKFLPQKLFWMGSIIASAGPKVKNVLLDDDSKQRQTKQFCARIFRAGQRKRTKKKA